MTALPSGAFTKPDTVYLLSHSIGLPPKTSSVDVLDRFMKVWATDPAQSWPRWLEEIDGFRHELAELLGTAAEWICPQTNVSSATTKIIQSLPNDPSTPVIVLSERTFPSIGFVAEAATRAGKQTRIIPVDSDAADLATWQNALTSDVGLVIVSHAESDTGTQLPVHEIVELARANGSRSIIDVAQSAGVLPINAAEWNADFLVGSCIKWLCGGPGAGFLWVNPDTIDACEPVDVGWFSHQDPFEFDINDFRYADDALRFWGGTPSPLPATIACQGISLLNGTGIAEIRRHNLALTNQLIEGLPPGWLVSPEAPVLRSGTVVVAPHSKGDGVAHRLHEAGVQVDQRSAGVRLSPHLYNTTDDIDRALDALTGSAQQ